MPSDDAKSVATECLRAWTTGDFETACLLLHDDLTFAGPLGTREGADAYLEGLKGLARVIKSAPQHRVIAEGKDVCIHYDMVTIDGTVIPIVGWYQVRNGKIPSVRAFFDPRPLLSMLQQHTK
jgi:ketosteroid isomerase-like protein